MKPVKFKSQKRYEFKQDKFGPIKLMKIRALSSETFLADFWTGTERTQIVVVTA